MTSVQNDRPLSDWLPASRDEMQRLGWDQADIILITGDAYVDHPAFGAAVIGRLAAAKGFKVAIIAQPNWRDDLRDFKKMGEPRYFFGITSGNMDSMVNHYTAFRRLRSDDAYTPGGNSGFRPDYAVSVYAKAVKSVFPESKIILGGVEASLRRTTHYDYWSDSLKEGILSETKADLLLYGMATLSFNALLDRITEKNWNQSVYDIPQLAYLLPSAGHLPPYKSAPSRALPSHAECAGNKKSFADHFVIFETESNRLEAARLTQDCGDHLLVINPPWHPMTEKEADLAYDLPYTRLPHPRYKKRGNIPAWEMIRHSVNIHTGCFGGCSFCTISAHQGKFISSRSEASILREIKTIASSPGFKGMLSDLGGPSANMWKMGGRDIAKCKKCSRPSCIYPRSCSNLDDDHAGLIRLYRNAASINGVKKILIGSGIRYDMLTGRSEEQQKRGHYNEYMAELARHHIGGRIKIAPEHTSDKVLDLMRKPGFDSFREFSEKIRRYSADAGLKQQVVPYLMSSHPGCSIKDMADLALETKKAGCYPEQVQDFTPTPLTLSSVMYYCGFNPYSGEKVFSARDMQSKREQKLFFFWYKPENHQTLRQLILKNKLGPKYLSLFPSEIKKRY